MCRNYYLLKTFEAIEFVLLAINDLARRHVIPDYSNQNDEKKSMSITLSNLQQGYPRKVAGTLPNKSPAHITSLIKRVAHSAVALSSRRGCKSKTR